MINVIIANLGDLTHGTTAIETQIPIVPRIGESMDYYYEGEMERAKIVDLSYTFDSNNSFTHVWILTEYEEEKNFSY